VTTTTQRRRGRPSIPNEVQRKRLIDAALRAFEKTHYEKTSVADIVREAKMSSRSFYAQFKSKEDLVAELVEERAHNFLEQLQSKLTEPIDLTERVNGAIRTYLELFPVANVDLERLGGEAGERVHAVRRHYVQLLTDFNMRGFATLYEQGEIARIPPRATVELLMTGIEGLTFRYYSEGRREELLALHPVLLSAFLRVLWEPSGPKQR
jgi:AcrR family transcriptional regulator